ncbi:metallophosphoesterase [Planctomicrobium sp. SH661]|uniref:metallophosphoesterase n=1 Tax=Planctomicrobium sp. SH661 TaxID=3448124 RepID=UPI003F5AE5BF
MQLPQEITGPVAVIGDVHGQLDQLRIVLKQLAELPDYDRRWIVFIGDLVDRGPDPKGAIDLILETIDQHERTALVCGNHEYAMSAALKLIETPEYCDWSARWLDHYGCQTTFRSYGLEEFGDLAALRARVPESHQNLLANIPWCVEHPEYFFVHAGLDPAAPFELQRAILRERDFSLTRPQWLCSKGLTFQQPPRDCSRVVVSGHVRVPQVTLGPKRILVDTSGGEGGNLSCILLPENQVIHSDLTTPPGITKATPPPVPEAKKKGWFW